MADGSRRRLNRAKIDREASKLIRDAGIVEPPVDVNKLADSLSVAIEESDLGSDCSGLLVREGESAVIGINWAHHLNRKRFTVAHELGHFVLHDGDTYVDKKFAVRFRNLESGSGTVIEEREANNFAASLLMPADWVRQAFNDRGINHKDLDEAAVEIDGLADDFQVSRQAMNYRLVNLGLINTDDL